MFRAPWYRPTLVDPYRDYLRRRRAENSAVPVPQLVAEIREQGYSGRMSLLYRYITEGRVEADRLRTHPSPRGLAPAHPPGSPQRRPAGTAGETDRRLP